MLQTLPEPLIASVLRASPTTLDSNVSNLPTQCLRAAAHAALPALQARTHLELDCAKQSTATCIEILKLFSTLSMSQNHKTLSLQSIDLDSRPTWAARARIRALFSAWNIAVCSGPRLESVAGTARGGSRATPTNILIGGARMHLDQFRQLLKPLAKCSTLQRLTISDVGLHTAHKSSFQEVVFAVVLQCKDLVSLTLCELAKRQLGVDSSYTRFLSSMSKLCMLTELKLQANESQIVPNYAKAMASSLPHMPQLRALSFNFIQDCPDTESIALSSAFSRLSVLTSLSMAENGARSHRSHGSQHDPSSAWPKLLPALVSLTTLKHLSLTKLKLNSDAAEPITQAIHAMHGIEALALDWDNIWTAELVLSVLDALKATGSCTKLVLKGDCIGWFDYRTSEVLDVALAQACLLPSLHHLDMQCECKSILQARHIAEQRDELFERLDKVQNRVDLASQGTQPALPSLTYLSFHLSSSPARRIFYAALPGMSSLLQLYFSAYNMKDENATFDDIHDDNAQLQAGLCALASVASLQELHTQYSAIPLHTAALGPSLEQLCTLTCLDLRTLDARGHGCLDRVLQSSIPVSLELWRALTALSSIKKLTLRDIILSSLHHRASGIEICPYPFGSGDELGKSLQTMTSLVDLTLTDLCPKMNSLSVVIPAIAYLTHLERLSVSIIPPSRQCHEETRSQVTLMLTDALKQLMWLESVTLGNIRLSSDGACMRTLAATLSRLPALRHVELRSPGLSFEDYEAVGWLLRSHACIRSMITGLPGRPLELVGLDERDRAHEEVFVEHRSRALTVANDLIAAADASSDPLRCRELIRRCKLGTRAIEYYGWYNAASRGSQLSSSLLKAVMCCCAP